MNKTTSYYNINDYYVSSRNSFSCCPPAIKTINTGVPLSIGHLQYKYIFKMSILSTKVHKAMMYGKVYNLYTIYNKPKGVVCVSV